MASYTIDPTTGSAGGGVLQLDPGPKQVNPTALNDTVIGTAAALAMKPIMTQKYTTIRRTLE